jgi:hypothetical protein
MTWTGVAIFGRLNRTGDPGFLSDKSSTFTKTDKDVNDYPDMDMVWGTDKITAGNESYDNVEFCECHSSTGS